MIHKIQVLHKELFRSASLEHCSPCWLIGSHEVQDTDSTYNAKTPSDDQKPEQLPAQDMCFRAKKAKAPCGAPVSKKCVSFHWQEILNQTSTAWCTSHTKIQKFIANSVLDSDSYGRRIAAIWHLRAEKMRFEYSK